MAQKSVKKDRQADQRRMLEVIRILKRTYSDAECSLDHKSPFELLVATILSAQCTDERVNQVTPALFGKYPTAPALASAPLPAIEGLIRSTGFYKNKAKALKHASESMVAKHGGDVPRTMEELLGLRGVGRKTANVVLGVAFHAPVGIVVDTHVGRLSRRLGFTRQENPVKVEQELTELVPREDWTLYSHLLIFHGRAICTARNPLCEECPLTKLCPKIGVARD